jgi:hypothetical protein
VTTVFPELVTGREDGFADGPWRVRPGSSSRGGASCNLTERILEVPLGRDAVARVVRAHELVHSRVSPHESPWKASLADVDTRALECAEELRVNTLVGRLGFDVTLLCDGTEKEGGRRLAESGAWDEVACFLLAVMGTGAERAFLAGVRHSQPEWMGALRALQRRVRTIADDCATPVMSSTRLGEDAVPQGYAAMTVVVARLVTSVLSARIPVGATALRHFRRSLETGGRRPPSGRFAPLVFAADVEVRSPSRVRALRRDRPATSGTVLRHPERLLTDPLQRGFTRATRYRGGIVVIDQSGSMDLDASAMQRVMRCAPDALVVGYSHRPGDRGATPNAWLLVSRGRTAAEWPTGNVGNGVDGPVLRWALARRVGGEPVVWVTDGQVTDSNDHPDAALAQECADLVLRHRVRLTHDVSDAARLLGSRAIRSPVDYGEFGRVGRAIVQRRGH